MEQQELMDLINEAIVLTIQLSAPIMIIGLVVGVAVALFQALTQIQEMTLVFVPKILAIFAALYLLLPFMTSTLIQFMQLIGDRIVAIQ
ncbi:MAG: flagellar biosynthesis protein FliQ [Pseudomonadota bacterium]